MSLTLNQHSRRAGTTVRWAEPLMASYNLQVGTFIPPLPFYSRNRLLFFGRTGHVFVSWRLSWSSLSYDHNPQFPTRSDLDLWFYFVHWYIIERCRLSFVLYWAVSWGAHSLWFTRLSPSAWSEGKRYWVNTGGRQTFVVIGDESVDWIGIHQRREWHWSV